MKRPQPIAVLTVPFGSAHDRTADAISKAWISTSRPASIRVVGLRDYLPPRMVNSLVSAYLAMVRYSPWLFSTIYHRGREPGISRIITRLAVNVAKPAAKRLLSHIAEPPAVWLSTHPMTNFIAGVARNGTRADPPGIRSRAPLTVLITDHHFHAFWCFPDVDTYFVGRSAMRRALSGRGIPQSRVRLTGIPIDPEFSIQKTRRDAERALGLSSHPFRILLLGGGLGIGPIEELSRRIISMDLAVQLLVVAGLNSKLRERLSLLGNGVKVYGYVDTIHTLMAASDLCMTKPGGLSLSEAAAVGLPTVMFEALPGQEEANSDTLARTGAAYLLGNLSRTEEIITALMRRPSLLRRMGRRMARFGKPRAAFDVADTLEQLWYRSVR